MKPKSSLSIPLSETDIIYLKKWICGKVSRDESGCWNWTGTVKPNGYGCAGYNKIRYHAHRLSYAVFVDAIPDDMTIDHLCKNRKCLNPAHMEVVTQAENALRGESSPAQNARKTMCKRGHELVPMPEDRRLHTSAKRHCPICGRIDAIEWNKNHRERKNKNNTKYAHGEKGQNTRREYYARNRERILLRLKKRTTPDIAA